MRKRVSILVQECKRSIVYKWFARSENQNLNNIIFDIPRIGAHRIIIYKKKISLRFYQEKDKAIVQQIMAF